MAIIETNKLTKLYGKGRGIVNLNITVEEGESFGFIGPNGAGKSTTIRTLLNFIFPTRGSAFIFGMDVTRQGVSIKAMVGYVPSEVNYYKEMKVKDIIKYAKSFHRYVEDTYIEQLYEQFELEPHKRIGELSLGNRKKVAVLQALIHKPRLLILDEPAIGLDPLMQVRLFEILRDVNRRGTTIFMSSHNLMDVRRFCHRVAIIKEGTIVDIKKVEDLIESSKRKITLKTNDKIEDELVKLKIQNIDRIKNTYTFTYEDSIDKLIKLVATYKIEDILVEELTLEDKFLHYYEGEKL